MTTYSERLASVKNAVAPMKRRTSGSFNASVKSRLGVSITPV
jgi:hypothetical protein